MELEGQVVLGVPLDMLTLVHHAESVAQMPDKRRDPSRVPMMESGQRICRAFSDIDTGEEALLYRQVLGEEDYVAFLARLAIEEGAGRSGALGKMTGRVLETRPLMACALS